MIRVFEGLENIEKISNPIVAIGNFDGVHRGHRELIKTVLDESVKIGGTPSVLTFYPHPLTVINPYIHIEQITPLQEKIDILENLGITHVYLIKFDDEFSSMRAKDFVEKVLVEKIGVRKIIVGYDFSFGMSKEGNIDLLKSLANIYGFDVIVVPPFKEEDKVISSTKIRGFLKEGKIKLANTFLGRAYKVKGIVIKGRKIGRLLGFPTANLLITDYLIPRKGVYAAYAYIDGKKLKAVVSIGPAPTFHIDSTSFEVHLIDFDNEIYGKEITVEFVERLRGIEKFKDIDSLKLQINEDINKARAILE